MGKNLVIVESPAKAKTINKMLGEDFVVKASMGHVRDLPARKFGVDFKKDFEPEYVIVDGRKKVIQDLRQAAAKASSVFLAPDPDREGEAIAWHLEQLLQEDAGPDRIHRVLYNEITPTAVRAAFEHPGKVDRRKVDSQQARRILDRIVGYKVSPLLWRNVRRGLSAGRVQSVALRLVCEREQTIANFVPEAFWIIGARVRKETDPLAPFEIRLARIDGEKAEVHTAEHADRIRQDLENRTLRVAKITTREITKRPPPPYITSTLQQAGSSHCHFSPARTMRIAQKLYEGVDLPEGTVGLITYMRTDSVRAAPGAVEACRALIQSRYGADYVPEKPNVFKSRSGAQEAHEAIRPTDVTRTPDSLQDALQPEEQRLYRLIWNRFVASQMAAAKIAQRTAEVEAVGQHDAPPDYLFRISASEVTFPGYMTVSGAEEKHPKGEGEQEEEAAHLPPLAEGERLHLLEWLSERKETQPPSRYSEASLVRALEEEGVGRPSTYAQILSTLNQRGYVKREKRTLTPTELGMQVHTFLVANLAALFDVKFTAGMEKLLDEIENGKIGRVQMLREFYARFQEWLAQVQETEIPLEKPVQVLKILEGVREWAPEVTRGKRTFSDEKFVESLRKQVVERKKKPSLRQWEVLLRLACRYKEQIPEISDLARELGEDATLTPKQATPPKETTRRKLALLASVQFEAPSERAGRRRDDRQFVASLAAWVEGGRALSFAQARALDRIMLKYAGQIQDFEAVREELDLPKPEEAADPQECAALLERLEPITEWAPPVKRGRREWSDKSFYESVRRQFAEKQTLSQKQVKSLRRLVKKYHEHLPESVDETEKDQPPDAVG
ncbi:MAG: type I DNA topoisomerase [Kiritimatiellae bacterium]|nr:type I DNA topoisomerase [Kiritimatiellia bacterium]